MINPENIQTFDPNKKDEKSEYKSKFPFSHDFPDGTVGKYETEEEMKEAVQEYYAGL